MAKIITRYHKASLLQFQKLSVLAVLVTCFSPTADAAASAIEAAFPKPADARGVVVIAGESDIKQIITLVEAAPVIALVIANDAKSVDQLKEAVFKANRLGQIHVAALGRDGRIPLADQIAATVILGKNPPAALTHEEANRVLHPFGKLHQLQEGRWVQTTKARPKEMDDWGHFHKDATSSEHSQDTVVGPPRGIQWIFGPTFKQPYNLIMQDTVLTEHGERGSRIPETKLVANNAFSGLPIWQSELAPLNRFCLVADADSVYVHAGDKNRVQGHTVCLDRRTGIETLVYNEGLDLTVTPEQEKAKRGSFREMVGRAEDLQLRVSENVLAQVMREKLVLLDAKTGKRLWSRDAGEGLGFVHPIIAGETFYVAEGQFARRSSYTHWPMCTPELIHAFELRTGKPKWTFQWSDHKWGEAHAIYNLQVEGNLIGGAVTMRIEGNRKPQAHGLVLNAKTGEVVYWGRQPDAWPGATGAGHSHVRMLFRGSKVWTMDIASPIARWDVSAPEKFLSFTKTYKGQIRPVACTVWRSTPNWWYGGVAAYPLSAEGRPYLSGSGRSGCDIGAFPANGLLYSPPNACACQPYLPGNKVYHSRPVRSALPLDQRFEKGSAQPAPLTKDDRSGWPMWGRDSARSLWQTGNYPTQLKPIWHRRNETTSVNDLLEKAWQSDGVIRASATQATCAEGVVVFALPHRHQIVALDMNTGREKWRSSVEGRVDMAPTISNGLVLAGTRSGFIYALNRDTGELVWRFLAAPTRDHIAVNGQLESAWPVFGSIPVDEQGLIAIAGRHFDADGGLWWYQIDPPTGRILAHGRLGRDELSSEPAFKYSRRPIDRPSAQNSVVVMNKDWLLLPGANLRRVNGRIGQPSDRPFLGPESFASSEEFDKTQQEQKLFRLGANAIIGEETVTIGGWRKPTYADTLARIYAIRGDEFISVGGGIGTASGRGGGGGSNIHRLRWLEKPIVDRKPRISAGVVWEHDEVILKSRSLSAVSAIAVCDNAVYLGMSVENIRDRQWREAYAEMPHRLRVLDFQTGKILSELKLPARVQQGGIALADGKVVVAMEDGSILSLGDTSVE